MIYVVHYTIRLGITAHLGMRYLLYLASIRRAPMPSKKERKKEKNENYSEINVNRYFCTHQLETKKEKVGEGR